MKIMSIIAVIATLTGCTQHMGTFTVLSNRSYTAEDLEHGKLVKQIEGRDVSRIIIAIPTGIPTIFGAVSDALEKADGIAMKNVSIEHKYWYIPYLYGEISWIARGDVIREYKK